MPSLQMQGITTSHYTPGVLAGSIKTVGCRVDRGEMKYNLLYNESAKKSLCARIEEYVETAPGAFRIAHNIDKLTKFLFEILRSFGKELGKGFSEFGKISMKSWQLLALFSSPKAVAEAKEAIQKARKEGGDWNYIGAIEKVLGAVAGIGYGSAFVAGIFGNVALSARFKAISDFPDAGETAIKGTDAVRKLYRARKERAAIASAEIGEDDKISNHYSLKVQRFFRGYERVQFLKVAKAVCSLAGFVLGLIALGTPPVLLAGLAFASTATALYAGIAERSLPFQEPKDLIMQRKTISTSTASALGAEG